ncbi:MAG: hypothetical protein PHW53_03635 [Patescibacteria group bacterium]|nr:hypothetical protein [Patescibacteria group bacterium]
MMNNNFDQEVLGAIKDSKLTPKPRWQFILKDYALWVSAIACLLIGGVFVSLVIFMSRFSGWEIYRRIDYGVMKFILAGIPLFWILLLIIFTLAVYFNFRHTKKGYRLSMPTVLFGVLFLSVMIGIFFNFMGFSPKIDNFLGRKAPFYDRVMNPHLRVWSSPDEGRLSGLITSIEPDRMTIMDLKRDMWMVITHDIEDHSRVKTGMPALFLGKELPDHVFNASAIMPMEPGQGFFRRLEPRLPPMP